MALLKRILYIAAALAAVAFFSCSDEKGFVIRGELSDLPSRDVVIRYYAAGGMKTVESPVHKGKFEIRGLSSAPTLVSLSGSDGTPVAWMIVSDGDDMTVRGNVADPYGIEVKGNRPSTDLARFMADNAEALRNSDIAAVNRAVAEYISSNPGSPAAGALLSTRFYSPGYERLADSLLSLLRPEGRPASVMQNYGSMLGPQVASETHLKIPSLSLCTGGDTLVRFNPSRQSYSMIAIAGTARSQRDSVARWLRLFSDSLPKRRFRALEISMADDSASWRRAIDRDSARWPQAWIPGGTAAPPLRKMNIPCEPYFIVCDSTGAQLYRGASVSRAADEIRRRLNANHLRPQ